MRETLNLPQGKCDRETATEGEINKKSGNHFPPKKTSYAFSEQTFSAYRKHGLSSRQFYSHPSLQNPAKALQAQQRECRCLFPWQRSGAESQAPLLQPSCTGHTTVDDFGSHQTRDPNPFLALLLATEAKNEYFHETGWCGFNPKTSEHFSFHSSSVFSGGLPALTSQSWHKLERLHRHFLLACIYWAKPGGWC